MSNDPKPPRLEDQGQTTDALSKEVLKLKVDDLFQEVESLKRRVERLEVQLLRVSGSTPESPAPAQGVVSNPDRRP